MNRNPDKPPSSPLPPDLYARVERAAVSRGILDGDRTAIRERFWALGRDLFPDAPVADGEAERTGGVKRGNPADNLREIGEAYWKHLYAASEKRRLDGSVYTPIALIDRILDRVWENLFPSGGAGGALCDPALGCGFFPLRVVERMLAGGVGDVGAVRRWARERLYGVDIDPGAVFVARVLLWLALSDDRTEFVPDSDRLVCGDSLLGPAFGEAGMAAGGLDWAAAFPEIADVGGFDCIVGNPPYEVLTNFARHPQRKTLARALRLSGHYRDALSGQVNLYRCFIERSLALLRPGGALSMIVPLSLARDDAAAPLRRRLLLDEAAGEWLLFGERERLFAGVTQSACIFRAVRGGGEVSRLRIGSGRDEIDLTLADLGEIGGEGLALPDATPESARVWAWLAANCRGRLDDVAAMRVGEVDQTVFRECMRDGDTGCLLARGAHLVPFRLDVKPVPGKERFLDLDCFLAKKGRASKACRERADRTRVVQLGIRNLHSLPRLVAALAPPGVYLGNSLNVYEPREGVRPEYLAGVLNSAILDWLFRSTSGNNNINIREMRRLPFPSRPRAEDEEKVVRAYRACAAAAAGGDLPAARRTLDDAVAKCYGLPDGLYRLVMETA